MLAAVRQQSVVLTERGVRALSSRISAEVKARLAWNFGAFRKLVAEPILGSGSPDAALERLAATSGAAMRVKAELLEALQSVGIGGEQLVEATGEAVHDALVSKNAELARTVVFLAKAQTLWARVLPFPGLCSRVEQSAEPSSVNDVLAQGLSADTLALTCVDRVVLIEGEWVLRAAYKYDRQRIHDALQVVVHHERVTTEDPTRVSEGLRLYATGLDVADAFIRAFAPAGAVVVTFDEQFVKRSTASPEVKLVP